VPSLDRASASQILDLVHDAIIVRDMGGCILQWNLAAEQQYGWSRREALGQNLRDLLRCAHPLPLPAIEQQLLVSGGWEGEFGRLARHGGTVLAAARWALRRDRAGRPVHIVETSRDITERRKAERARRLSEDRYRNLFEALAVAFCEVEFAGVRRLIGSLGLPGGSDLRAYMLEHRAFVREMMKQAIISDVNEKALVLFGASRKSQIVGGDLEPYWPAASEALFVEAVVTLESQRHYSAETRLITRQGEALEVLLTASRSPKSRQDGTVLLGLIDIGDRIRAQDTVRRLQADFAHAARVSVLGELTASIAHEVNQPLAAIATNGEAALHWLAREELAIDELRAIQRRIIADARRAADIVQRVRSMAQRSEPERAAVDVKALLEEVVLFLGHDLQAHDVEVTMLVAPAVPAVVGDRTQLQQVFVNLALNAIQSMGAANAHYECIKAFSETDFTGDLKQIEVPVLVAHGTDDQIVPYADSAPLSAGLLKQGTLQSYEGLPHGMLSTNPEILNPDLLAFIRGEPLSAQANAGDAISVPA